MVLVRWKWNTKFAKCGEWHRWKSQCSTIIFRWNFFSLTFFSASLLWDLVQCSQFIHSARERPLAKSSNFLRNTIVLGLDSFSIVIVFTHFFLSCASSLLFCFRKTIRKSSMNSDDTNMVCEKKKIAARARVASFLVRLWLSSSFNCYFMFDVSSLYLISLNLFESSAVICNWV